MYYKNEHYINTLNFTFISRRTICVDVSACCSEHMTSDGYFRAGQEFQLSMYKNTFTPSADIPPKVSLHTSFTCSLVTLTYCYCTGLASEYTDQLILSWSLSPEMERIAAGMVSGIKIPWGAWLGLLSLSSVWLLQACWWSYSERCE